MKRISVWSALFLSSLLLVTAGCENSSQLETVGPPAGQRKAEAKEADEKGVIEFMDVICPVPALCIIVKDLRLVTEEQEASGEPEATENVDEPVESPSDEAAQKLPAIAGKFYFFPDDENEKGDLVEQLNQANQRPLGNIRALRGDNARTKHFDIESFLFYDEQADLPILMIAAFRHEQEVDELPFVQVFFKLKVTKKGNLIIDDFVPEVGDEVRKITEVIGVKEPLPAEGESESSPATDTSEESQDPEGQPDQEDPSPETTWL